MSEAFVLQRSSILAVSFLAILGGCASGPDYRTPELPLAPAFANAPATPLVTADQATLTAFWRQFNDPALDDLVQASLKANLDVRIAQARLMEARATLQGAQADNLPTLGLEASATRSLSPQWQFPGSSRSQRTGTVYAPSALMNWELDLFGRNARAIESAAALVSAQELGIGSAQAVVVASVATNYLNLRGQQQRLNFAEESLKSQQESLRLTVARADAGRGTTFDVERARNLVASTAASIPAQQAALARNLHRLSTLAGLSVAEVTRMVGERRALPGLPVTDLAQLPVGTPAALLRRRPDIQVAERQLASSSAEVGVAMADRFPRVSLSGLLGLNSNRFSDLSDGGSGVYSLGASLSWTALDFGRTRSRIDAAQARSDRSLLVYEQTVLVALEETENALSTYSRSAQQAAQLELAARSAQVAADISRRRFAAGSSDLLTVLDTERQLLTARDQLVQAQAATASALVDVYRALGGGWQVPSSSGASLSSR